eukprot:FR737763.1.p1 GENE.FR737763.1~~FR737763.1.p1  ORF type:complete len:164 (+),score=15.34 FR737763.1:1-492(+)
MAFGKHIEPTVTLNLPEHPRIATTAVRLAFCVAVFFTYPFVLFPVTNILESYVLPESSLFNPSMKWKKNCFRLCVVLCTGLVSMAAGEALENLVSLIGGTCCVPLALIYPALLHDRIVGTHPQRDRFFVVVGCGTCVFATSMAILSWQNKSSYYCADVATGVS